MTKQIFSAVCVAALAVFAATLALLVGVLHEYFTSIQQTQLRTQTNFAARGVEQQGQAYFDGLAMGEYRATWIGADGSVLYDNSKESVGMQNHLDREEVRQALADGYGHSARYSATLMERSMYCARRLADGTVLRLSVTQHSVLRLLIGMAGPIALIVLAAVVLSFVFAGRLSRRFADITLRERAYRQRREFAANVSHELKTPLHSISGYSELLMSGIAKAEDAAAFAEKIYTETQRLIALVGDIISLSHLDEGVHLSWGDVDLYQIAGKAVQSLSPLAAEKGIALTLIGEPAVIRGVQDLVFAIAVNLCDNAIKYTSPGGKVDVEVHNGVLTVRDTGIGIPPEHLDRIFERFYRVDKGRSKEAGGTGLGLSIVKHAAAIHHAKVDVSSRPGQGTTVTVAFARTAPA